MEERFYQELFDFIDFITSHEIEINEYHFDDIKDIYCDYKGIELPNGRVIDFRDNKKDDNSFAFFNSNREPFIGIYTDKIRRRMEFNNLFMETLYIIQSLLHEFEHLYQHQMFLNVKNIKEIKTVQDYEDAIISYSLFLGCLKHYLSKEFRPDITKKIMRKLKLDEAPESSIFPEINRVYTENYTIEPNERMAEIKSLTYIRDMLRKYSDNTDAINLYNHNLNFRLIHGYEFSGIIKINCPTYMFFEKIGLDSVVKQLKLYNLFNNKNFTTYDKLLLGIPAKIGEYVNIVGQFIESENNEDYSNDLVLERKK